MVTVNKNVNRNELDGVEARILANINTAKQQIQELEQRLRVARGTGDVGVEAAAARASLVEAPPPVKIVTLEEQIETHLRRQIMTTAQLSKAIGVPADQVIASIKKMRPRIHNLGTPECARWTWRIGSDAAPAELRALVERLITHTPLEFRELVTATGARDGLVQGHLVELRKSRDVIDLGSSSRARWFIVPETARHARLPVRRGGK